MRILFLWKYYEQYIRRFYARRPRLSDSSHFEQQTALLDDYFGWPGYLVRALTKLNHEAEIVFANVQPLQAAWARENNVAFASEDGLVAEQIRHFQPEVLFMGPWYMGNANLLRVIRPLTGRIFIWIASPMRESPAREWIDCILTSFPHYVSLFQEGNVPVKFFQPACFDPAIIDVLPQVDRDIPVSFVGGLAPASFTRRIDVLSQIARQVPLRAWGYGLPSLPPRNPALWRSHMLRLFRTLPLHRVYHGEVYGLDTYRVFGRSQITLNVHIDVAEGVASNMRLFETTGCGALLITEASPFLSHYYVPGREVETYQSIDELLEKIRFYLSHESERQAISKAGQARTLAQHSAQARASELLDCFQN